MRILLESPLESKLLNTPLDALCNGSSAVIFFFVLSGFVLNLRFAQAQAYGRGWWAEFIVRRLFRIYPAFLAVILLAVAVRSAGFGDRGASYSDNLLSDTYALFWSRPFNGSDVARTLTLIGPGIDRDLFDPPMWSLIMEMRISLVFPLIILAVSRNWGATGDAVVLAVAYAGAAIAANAGISTLTHVPHFVLGAMLARHSKRLAVHMMGLPGLLRALVPIAAFVLYSAGSVIESYGQFGFSADFAGCQLVGLGAAGFITVGLCSARVKGFLNAGVLQFMGRTSYSFYLLHLVVLVSTVLAALALAGRLGFKLPAVWPLCAISLFVTYFLSYGLFRLVEVPCNRFGRRVASGLCRT